MISVSTAVATEINKLSRRWDAKLIKVSDSSIIDCDIKSVTVHKGACGEFSVGSVYIPYIDVEIYGDYSYTGEVKLQFGVLVNDAFSYIDIGYFEPTTIKKEISKTTIKAQGRLSKMSSEVLYATEPSAKTLANVVSAVSAKGYNITYKNGFSITSAAITQPLVGITCRDALQIVATCCGGFVTEDNAGNICLCKFNPCASEDLAIDGERTTQNFSFDGDFTVNGCKVIVDDETSYSDSTYTLEVTNPYFTADMWSAFRSNMNGLTFESGEVPVTLGDPRLEAWDCVKVTDNDDEDHMMPCFEITYTFDGGLSMTINDVVETSTEAETNVSGPISSAISELSSRVSLSEREISSIEVSIDSLSTRVTTAEGKITAVEGDIDSLEGRVDTAEGKLTTIEGNITSLSGRVTSAETNIATIEDEIGDPSDPASASGSLYARVTNVKNVADAAVEDITEEVARAEAAEQEIEDLADAANNSANAAGQAAALAQTAAEAVIEANYRKYNAISLTSSQIATQCAHGYSPSGGWARATADGYYQGACNVGDVLLIYVTNTSVTPNTVHKLLVRVTAASAAGAVTYGEVVSYSSNINAYFWHDNNGAHVSSGSTGFRTDLDGNGMQIVDASGNTKAEFGDDEVNFYSYVNGTQKAYMEMGGFPSGNEIYPLIEFNNSTRNIGKIGSSAYGAFYLAPNPNYKMILGAALPYPNNNTLEVSQDGIEWESKFGDYDYTHLYVGKESGATRGSFLLDTQYDDSSASGEAYVSGYLNSSYRSFLVLGADNLRFDGDNFDIKSPSRTAFNLDVTVTDNGSSLTVTAGSSTDDYNLAMAIVSAFDYATAKEIFLGSLTPSW